MTYEYFDPGVTIFKQGDYGDKFYINFGGLVSVLIKEKKENSKEREVNIMKFGETFGDLSLVGKNLHRTASCKTLTKCHFGVLKKSQYIMLLLREKKL